MDQFKKSHNLVIIEKLVRQADSNDKCNILSSHKFHFAVYYIS